MSDFVSLGCIEPSFTPSQTSAPNIALYETLAQINEARYEVGLLHTKYHLAVTDCQKPFIPYLSTQKNY